MLLHVSAPTPKSLDADRRPGTHLAAFSSVVIRPRSPPSSALRCTHPDDAGRQGTSDSGHCRPRPGVDALALRSEETEDLHRLRSGTAEPVRYAGVELGRFTGGQGQVVVAQPQPGPPGQHVEPLVALMALQVDGPRAAARDDQLVRAESAGLRGERHDRHAVSSLWALMHPRIARWRRADQLVERHLVAAGQREEQLQAGPPAPGPPPGEG